MSNTLSYKNANINYTDAGKGEAVVFLHGFLESLEMWDEFADELKERFRVVCIDLPGFGESEMIAEIHTMDLYADCVNAVLDHLKIEKCVITGHSMGGYVSLAFADKYPDRIAGLGIFHSQAAEDDPEAKKNRDRAIRVIQQNHIGFVKEFIPDLFAPENVDQYNKEIKILKERAGKITKEAIIAAMAGMRDRESKIEVLKRINIPVLFIAGKLDKRIPLNKVLEQAKLVTHSEILVLGDIGHMGFLEAKDKCLRKMKYFIETCYNL